MRRVAVLAAVFLFATSTPAGADDDAIVLADLGWWHRAEPSPVGEVGLPIPDPLAPQPPETADGQIAVGASEGEATAVGALRFEIPAGASAVELKLPIETLAGEGSIVACVAGSAWDGVDGGDWAEKPLVDCGAGSAVADPPNDGTLTIDARDLQVGRTVNIVLVLSEGADLEAVLGPVRSEHLSAARGSSPTSASAPAPASPPGRPPLLTTPAAGPSSPLIQPPIALPDADQGRSATGPVAQAAAPAPATTPALSNPPGTDSSAGFTARIVAALIAAALLTVWFRSRSVGAEADLRGLGDFTRERTVRPASLR